VGLAQALMHDPPVLILDEPTSGLDPNQLVEIRALIRRLGSTKTVILSTHIMQEVQAICDRVVIIDRGKIVIDRPIAYLSGIKAGGQVVHVEFDREILVNTLKALPAIHIVTDAGERVYKVHSNFADDLRPVLFKYAVEKSIGILEMYTEKESVEDVFRQFTNQPTGDKV